MDPITILRPGAVAAAAGSPDYFTGSVSLETLVPVTEPSRLAVARVTFEPGARTAWHTHPLGQTLIVVAGRGWVQEAGRPPQEIQEGDTVRIAPGVKHWHGAGAAAAMTHLAIQESHEGRTAEWLEPVSDEEYPRS